MVGVTLVTVADTPETEAGILVRLNRELGKLRERSEGKMETRQGGYYKTRICGTSWTIIKSIEKFRFRLAASSSIDD